jgi:hypothetical protein
MSSENPLLKRYAHHGKKVAEAMRYARPSRTKRFLIGIEPRLTIEGASIQARMNLGKLLGGLFPEYAEAYRHAGEMKRPDLRKDKKYSDPFMAAKISYSIRGTGSMLGAFSGYFLTLCAPLYFISGAGRKSKNSL